MLNKPTSLEVRDSITGKSGHRQLYFTFCGVGQSAIKLVKQPNETGCEIERGRESEVEDFLCIVHKTQRW